MKIKPVYVYIVSFIVIIGLLVIFTSESEQEKLPTEDVNPHSEMPDDDIHKNLEGNGPSGGNVTEEFRQKMDLMKEQYESDPSDTTHAKQYARMLAAAHQPRNAVEIYKGILTKDKNRLDIRFELATVYYNMQEYDDAKDQIEKVLYVKPNDLEAKYNLGAIEAAMGNVDRAREIWNNLVENHPNSEAAGIAQQSLQQLN